MISQQFTHRALVAVIICVLSLTSLSVHATRPVKGDKHERTEWMKEMRRYKAEYLAKKIDLTDEQKAKFILLYEEMDERTSTIEREARQMEREVKKKGDSANDTELEKAAEALTEAHAKQAAIELEYMPKFKAILSKRQLFELKGAEREFMRHLMERHRNSGKKK